MRLRDTQDNWDELAKRDPLWHILAAKDVAADGWDSSAFFETGEQRLKHDFDLLAAHDIGVPRGRALDFGCGVGRLTQALARRFEHADGVDASEEMVRLADEYSGDLANCSFHLSRENDLSQFESGSYDFVYSMIVLQHMKPKYALRYANEFLRVLGRGGVAWFQLPEASLFRSVARQRPQLPARLAGRVVPEALLRGLVHLRGRIFGEFPRVEVFCVPRKHVLAAVAAQGCEVLAVLDDHYAGPSWKSVTYVIRKP
jgi:SAM-dependent methyltransferase